MPKDKNRLMKFQELLHENVFFDFGPKNENYNMMVVHFLKQISKIPTQIIHVSRSAKANYFDFPVFGGWTIP